MTTIINNNDERFNFASKEAAVALYLDAKRTLEAMKEDMERHEAYMSDMCKAMLESFGVLDEETGKRSLQLDLGDGSPRGHIVVQRGDIYFIRERNTGRPKGSKNKTTKASSAPAAAAEPEAQPEVVVEETSAPAPTATAPTLSPMEQALAVAEAEERETEVTEDPALKAILQAHKNTMEAIKDHVRSVAPAAAFAGE